MGGKILFNTVFINLEQVVHFLLCRRTTLFHLEYSVILVVNVLIFAFEDLKLLNILSSKLNIKIPKKNFAYLNQ